MEKTPNAQLVAMLLHANASGNTLVILMLLVDLSVPQMQSVQPIRLVKISNVLTHVLDFVELMLNAELLTMLQPVLVTQAMLGIRLDHANVDHQVSTI